MNTNAKTNEAAAKNSTTVLLPLLCRLISSSNKRGSIKYIEKYSIEVATEETTAKSNAL